MKEKEIEDAVLRILNAEKGFFAWRFKDQSKIVNGSYKKNPWEIRGVSDLCLITDAGHTFWIEIKTPTGKQSEYQIIFQKKLESMGHKYVLIRSVEECKNFVGRLKKTEFTLSETKTR